MHSSPATLQGELCFFENFHSIPKISAFLPSAAWELPELWGQWEGKVVRGRSQSPIQARGQTIMKHTNTQLCVDSLPLFLPIHHNRPLIPPRSAHQGQTAPVQRTRTHLVEPKSGIILAYGRRRIEQGAHEAGVPGALTRGPAAPTTPLCRETP